MKEEFVSLMSLEFQEEMKMKFDMDRPKKYCMMADSTLHFLAVDEFEGMKLNFWSHSLSSRVEMSEDSMVDMPPWTLRVDC